MPTYTGFTTQNSNKPRTQNAQFGIDGGTGSLARGLVWGKKFTLYDQYLVQQDFINALSIRQGEKVGNPSYGTTIWTYIFEQNTVETALAIENEVRRVAGLDPRIILNAVAAYPNNEGVLVECEIAFQPFNEATALSLFFSRTSGTII